MKRILHFKNITFKSSYNWFKIDIHHSLLFNDSAIQKLNRQVTTNIKKWHYCIFQFFYLSLYFVRIFLNSNSSLPRLHKTVVVSQVSPNVTPNYFAGEHKGWIVDNRSPIFGCFCTYPFFSGSLLGLYSRSTSFYSTTLPFYSTLLFSSLPQCVRLQGVRVGQCTRYAQL